MSLLLTQKVSSPLPKFFLTLIVAVTAGSSFAQSPAEIEKTLKDFHSSEARTREMMNAPVQKFDRKGKLSKATSAFSGKDIRDQNFVSMKNKMRDQIYKINKQGISVSVKDLANQGRAAIESDDEVSDLVDNGAQAVRSIKKMDEDGLTSAKLSETPWSDTYWPLYQGTTANRYNDPNFPASKNWKENFDYVSKNSFLSNVDQLSPSEKYDLLVGDTSKTYTQTQWSEGQSYFQSSGSVETWMGICHGWAPAAYMLPRPEKTVTVTAADGRTKINFFPSDIKALASSLWASARTPSKFIGGRCDVKNPPQTSNGRVKAQECFDSNPGSWHMTVVNQIAIAKRSFVVDATYDTEVWNQPAYAYKYTYFNPKTLKASSSLESATIPLSEYTNDKFKEFRNNSRAVSVVGISMEFSYVVENNPSASETDSPAEDSVQTARYMYDLELDAQGNIVGGEWYTNLHPDFLWTPIPSARALTLGDRLATGRWNASSGLPVPPTFKAGARAASRSKMPLGKIVEALIKATKE